MFKKLNFKVLLVIFIALLAVFLITKMIENKKGERSFRKDLVTVSLEEVDGLTYIPEPSTGREIDLTKESEGWYVVADGITYNADGSVIENLISSLISLKPQRVAATSKSKWKEYQVTDSTGTRVTLFSEDKKIADLYIGKFSYQPQESTNPYQQQQGKMTSYVRLAGDKEIYAVEGFLKMSFQSDIKNLRLRSLIDINKEGIARVVYNYPGDASYTVSRMGTQFMIDGVVTDSTITDKYLATLARLSSLDFVDNVSFDFNNPSHKIIIESNSIPPIELKAFEADTVNRFIITSSANPGSFFSGSENDLFGKAFVGKDEFFAVEEEK